MAKSITLSKGGTAEKTVDVNSLQVPDLYHIAYLLQEQGNKDASEKVLECWRLTHALLDDVKNV